MSDAPLRIAFVGEGPTDLIAIEAALKAVLGTRTFTLTLLQPEPTRPIMGNGWCGVLKWCRAFVERGFPSLEQDPTLMGFELLEIHLDADVAGMKYENGGAAVVEAAHDLLALPCEQPCPPPAASVDALRLRLLSWLGDRQLGPRSVLCIPSKAIESWIAAAALPDGHKLLDGLECNGNLSDQLEALPTGQRIKKGTRSYRSCAVELTAQWERVMRLCSQASRFATDVRAALAPPVVEVVLVAENPAQQQAEEPPSADPTVAPTPEAPVAEPPAADVPALEIVQLPVPSAEPEEPLEAPAASSPAPPAPPAPVGES